MRAFLNDTLLRAWWFLREDWWLTGFGRWVCGLSCHGPGPVWYSNGNEPDMSCRRCGEGLG